MILCIAGVLLGMVWWGAFHYKAVEAEPFPVRSRGLDENGDPFVLLGRTNKAVVRAERWFRLTQMTTRWEIHALRHGKWKLLEDRELSMKIRPEFTKKGMRLTVPTCERWKVVLVHEKRLEFRALPAVIAQRLAQKRVVRQETEELPGWSMLNWSFQDEVRR